MLIIPFELNQILNFLLCVFQLSAVVSEIPVVVVSTP